MAEWSALDRYYMRHISAYVERFYDLFTTIVPEEYRQQVLDAFTEKPDPITQEQLLQNALELLMLAGVPEHTNIIQGTKAILEAKEMQNEISHEVPKGGRSSIET